MHPASRKALSWAVGLFVAHLVWLYLLTRDVFTVSTDMAVAPVFFIVHSVLGFAAYAAAALLGAAVVINVLAPRSTLAHPETGDVAAGAHAAPGDTVSMSGGA